LIVERLGQQIWRLISPLATRTLLPSSQADRRPLRDKLRAIRAGIVWGWLPCGLVYSMLVTAAVSGSGTQGAIWMAGFGLGTIPALWLASLLSQESLRRFQGTGLRRAAGLLIIGFGLWGLLRLSGVITVDWFDSFCIGGQAMGVSLK
jgi:sulfite exporter TauE/SafE